MKFPIPISIQGNGWPWCLPEPLPGKAVRNLMELPTVSIVVPSYNCGQYIEKALRSILLQGYPSLQLVVVDGASTDETLSVLGYYSSFIDIVISEPDCGQADAINKGLKLCTGEYLNWINADDMLSPGSLLALFGGLEKRVDIIASRVANIDPAGEAVGEPVRNYGFSPKNFLYGIGNYPFWMPLCYHQPGVWFSRERTLEVGCLNANYRYVFDQEYMIRYMLRSRDVLYSDIVSAYFLLRPGSKTVSESRGFLDEVESMHSSLLKDSRFSQILGEIKRSIDAREWYESMVELHSKSFRIMGLLSILLRAVSRPRSRFNRFTAGALLKWIRT